MRGWIEHLIFESAPAMGLSHFDHLLYDQFTVRTPIIRHISAGRIQFYGIGQVLAAEIVDENV